MKSNLKTLIICVAIPLAVGFVSSLLTRTGMESSVMMKPPLSPPGWIFPIVWTILYVLMGMASYLIVTSNASQQAILSALKLYAAQLAINFFWSIIFFNLNWYFIAFLWIILLWVLIFLTAKAFARISERAGYLLVPYFIWVTFAAYLTFGIWILN